MADQKTHTPAGPDRETTSLPNEDPDRASVQGVTTEGAVRGGASSDAPSLGLTKRASQRSAKQDKAASGPYSKIDKERREYIERELKVQEDPPPGTAKQRRLEEAYVVNCAARITDDTRRLAKLQEDEMVLLAAHENTRDIDNR